MRVEGLSKRYRNGSQCGGRYQYKSLRGVITNVLAAPFRRLRENSQSAIPVCRCTGRRNSQFEIGTGSRRSALSARRSVSPFLPLTFHFSRLPSLGPPCPRVSVSPCRRLVSRRPVSPVRLGAWRSALGAPFPRFTDSPFRHGQSAIWNEMVPWSRSRSSHASRFIFHVSRSLAVSRFTFHVSRFIVHVPRSLAVSRFTFHVSRFIVHVPRSLADSRFTFHVSLFTSHDSLLCPSVPQNEQVNEGNNVPHYVVSGLVLLSSDNSQSEIRNSQWPWSPVVSSQSSRNRPPHVSRFTFHVSRSHSAIRHSKFAIAGASLPITTPFTGPDTHSRITSISDEAHLLPFRTEARCPGRSCERESRRLPGLSIWSTPK